MNKFERTEMLLGCAAVEKLKKYGYSYEIHTYDSGPESKSLTPLLQSGKLDNMNLITRRGASISQQSFTFKAIRKASLPPMPPEVQADVIGELMELIFEFNFD